MSEKVVFVLGDKLPSYYDAAMSIYMVATKLKSKKMVSTINSYTKALIDIWKRTFGDLHVTSTSSVTNKLQKLVNIITLSFMLKCIANLKSIKRM